MKDVQKFAAASEPRRGDRVTGWFGEAVITDVSTGWVEDQITGEPITDPENVVRIQWRDGRAKYIRLEDIERNLTAEQSVLRA